MNQTKRSNGKLIRRIARLDRAWRLAGQPEGRTANRLAFELGNAARAGMYDKSTEIQVRSAARLGQRSGWAKY